MAVLGTKRGEISRPGMTAEVDERTGVHFGLRGFRSLLPQTAPQVRRHGAGAPELAEFQHRTPSTEGAGKRVQRFGFVPLANDQVQVVGPGRAGSEELDDAKWEQPPHRTRTNGKRSKSYQFFSLPHGHNAK